MATNRNPECSDDEIPWTAADQAGADQFERDMVALDEQWTGHSDRILLALVQAIGSLMARRLYADPGRLTRYLTWVARLVDHLYAAARDATAVRH